MPTILVADPNPVNRKIVELTFQEEGVEVDSCADGREAFERFRSASPALVLADVSLPRLDGYGLCRAIKSDPRGADTPVVLLAGRFEPFDRRRAEDAGYSSLMIKPVEPPALLDLARRLLRSSRPPSGERPRRIFSLEAERREGMLFDLPLADGAQKVVFPLKLYQATTPPAPLGREVVGSLPEDQVASAADFGAADRIAQSVLDKINARLPEIIRQAVEENL